MNDTGTNEAGCHTIHKQTSTASWAHLLLAFSYQSAFSFWAEVLTFFPPSPIFFTMNTRTQSKNFSSQLTNQLQGPSAKHTNKYASNQQLQFFYFRKKRKKNQAMLHAIKQCQGNIYGIFGNGNLLLLLLEPVKEALSTRSMASSMLE